MNVRNGNGSLVASTKHLNDLRTMLERKKSSLSALLPKHLSSDRLVKLALVGTSRNPALLNCSHESIFKALMEASECGLEPFSALNLAYIIPYKNNRSGVTEAQFIPSYRGLIDIARRSGEIKTIEAKIIYDRDKYEIEEGLTPKLIHIPCLDGKHRGDPVIVYAIARLKDGGIQYEIMTFADVEQIRKKSRAPNVGPWVEHWDAMAKKTCLKRLCKLLPTSPQLAKFIEKDNAIEMGEEIFDFDLVDRSSPQEIVETVSVQTVSKADEIADKLAQTQAP